jgi:hypothetical protein
LLPLITASTRERIAREFDDLGPDACMAEITRDLRSSNPELLDMASKCAADVGNSSKVMIGFGMFYRILATQTLVVKESLLNPLPRVTAKTRDLLVKEIDDKGSEAFTMDTIDDLDRNNPQLLQMAHNFASGQKDYIGVMQGFALLYKSLMLQSALDRATLH